MLLAGAIFASYRGSILLIFLVFITHSIEISKKMLLDSVFSKNVGTGRWIGSGTKKRGSEVGREWRQVVTWYSLRKKALATVNSSTLLCCHSSGGR